jgi:hypothetical protein
MVVYLAYCKLHEPYIIRVLQTGYVTQEVKELFCLLLTIPKVKLESRRCRWVQRGSRFPKN